MKKIGLALAMVLGVGCGGGDQLDGFIKDLEGFKGKMCECKDKECAEKIFTDFKKWENDKVEPAMKGKKETDFPKEKIAKWEETEKAMKDCRRKFRDEDAGGAGAGGDVPPPAPTP